MDRYQVQHSYTAYRDGLRYGPWVQGEEVELAEEDARWVNRDSPGALIPAQPDTSSAQDGDGAQDNEGQGEGEGERAGAPKVNRAHKGPQRRGKR